ncbi:MAG TPA: hypothetical protein DDW52_20310 [Planctomycetaceae bacterium]|nr:hypothetical protein [Planctomycetaceae bacterium]
MAADNPVTRLTLERSGWFLVAVGAFHFCIWLMSGEAWKGSVSWRKPTLFGVSGGLTLVSMGYLVGFLRPWRLDKWLARLLAGAMVLEVGLITVQQWRGVESHFNRLTTFDRSADILITVLITVVTCCILVFAVRACRSFAGRPDQKIAWRGGVMFLLLSCVIGFVIFIYGNSQSAVGAEPSVFGKSGLVKFPHGMTIHAIQLLPCACWLLNRLHVPLPERVTCLWLANLSLAFLLAYSILQTLAGRAREDFTLFTGGVVAIALLFTLPLWVAIAKALAAKVKSSGLAADSPIIE